MNKHNKKDIRHGYWEFKYFTRKVVCKYTFNNGILLGYRKRYYENGKIFCKGIDI
tara:strand:+ start:150 stop:314 length:165 start_codon:yes stop_codon:yes gene_type:complete